LFLVNCDRDAGYDAGYDRDRDLDAGYDRDRDLDAGYGYVAAYQIVGVGVEVGEECFLYYRSIFSSLPAPSHPTLHPTLSSPLHPAFFLFGLPL
jgi:hypothetical protein